LEYALRKSRCAGLYRLDCRDGKIWNQGPVKAVKNSTRLIRRKSEKKGSVL
jgi:hypothetical protein